MQAEVRRVWRPDWPCPAIPVLRQHQRGGGDPTFRYDRERGQVWRGIRTPMGPATLLVRPRDLHGEIDLRAWGPGSDWVLDSAPALLGADDDWSGFDPRHPVLADLCRRHPDLRLGRTGLVMESVIPAVIEQKVTGQEAFAGFRMLVHRYGERAPGPGAEMGLWLQPEPSRVVTIPSWEWLKLHIDPPRSRTLVAACRRADALQRLVDDPSERADLKLRSLPGVGVWTSAEVRQRALGDPDAVSFGDYHVAKNVGWAVTGREFDDRELADFLEPWRPHRGRVPMLVAAAGLARPRRGARMSPRTHLPAQIRKM